MSKAAQVLRRLILVVPAALLVVGLFAPVAGAVEHITSTDRVLVATEGGGELPGTSGHTADDPANPNPPAPYESPFLQNAAGALALGTLGLVGFLGLLYWVLVVRPRAAKTSA